MTEISLPQPEDQRIQLIPGLYVIADQQAGNFWIEAWSVLDQKLRETKDAHRIGENENDADNHQRTGRM